MKKLIILFAVLILVSIQAQAVNVDELMLDHLVEKGVISAEAAAAIRADAALKTQDEKALLTAFPVNGKTKINLSGTLQVLYAADETAGVYDCFKVRRARLDFKGDVSKQVGYELQIDAVQTLKTIAGTRVVTRPIILDAYIDFYLPQALTLRTGQTKIPFGRENLESDAKLDTINRSQVTEKLVPGRDNGSQGRDFGLLFNGEADFGREEKMLDYSIGVFNGAGLYYEDDNESKDLVSRIVCYPWPELTLGVSQYNGKSTTTEADKLRTGVEFTWQAGKLSVKGEYIGGRDGSISKSGWYLLALAKARPDLEVVGRYDTYDSNLNSANDRNNIVTAGLNWILNKWAKVQANYEIKTEETTQINNNASLVQATVTF